MFKLSKYYGNYGNSQTCKECWMKGWKLALQARKQIPLHIELFYMFYNPSMPGKIVDYDSDLLRILVYFTE